MLTKMRKVEHKTRIIEEIRVCNRSASERFLMRFDERALKGYLDRLTRLHGQRGPATHWTRLASLTRYPPR